MNWAADLLLFLVVVLIAFALVAALGPRDRQHGGGDR